MPDRHLEDGVLPPEHPSGMEGPIIEALEEVSAAEEEVRDNTPTGWVVWVFDHLAALVGLALLIGVTYAVIARTMGIAVLGVVELGGFALVLTTLLAAAGLVRRDGHVRVEIVDYFMKARGLKVVEIISILIQIAVTVVVFWATLRLAITDVERDRVLSYGNQYLPRIFVSGFLPLGMAGVLVMLLVRLVKVVREPAEPVDAADVKEAP